MDHQKKASQPERTKQQSQRREPKKQEKRSEQEKRWSDNHAELISSYHKNIPYR